MIEFHTLVKLLKNKYWWFFLSIALIVYLLLKYVLVAFFDLEDRPAQWLSIAVSFLLLFLFVFVFVFKHLLVRKLFSKLEHFKNGSSEKQKKLVTRLFGHKLLIKQCFFKALHLSHQKPLFLQGLIKPKKIYLFFDLGLNCIQSLKKQGWLVDEVNQSDFFSFLFREQEVLIVIHDYKTQWLNILLYFYASYFFFCRTRPLFIYWPLSEDSTYLDHKENDEKMKELLSFIASNKHLRRHQSYLLIGDAQLGIEEDFVTSKGESALLNFELYVQQIEKKCFFNSENTHGSAQFCKYAQALYKLYDLKQRLANANCVLPLYVCRSQHSRSLQWIGSATLGSSIDPKTQRQLKKVSLFFLYAFSGFFLLSFSLNVEKLSMTKHLVERLRRVNVEEVKKHYFDELENNSGLFKPKRDSWLMHFGLYKGEKVDHILNHYLINRMLSYFIPELASQLEKLLQASISKNAHIMPAMKSYKMIFENTDLDVDFVFAWLEKNQQTLDDRYLSNIQFKSILTMFDKKYLENRKINHELVNRGFAVMPDVEVLIKEKLLEMQNNNEMIALASDTLKNQLFIPKCYTKAYLIEQREKQYIEFRQLANDLSAIWNETREVVLEKIKLMYGKMYVAAWRKVLDSVAFKKGVSIEQVALLASQNASTNSPWMNVLIAFEKNTSFDFEHSEDFISHMKNACLPYHRMLSSEENDNYEKIIAHIEVLKKHMTTLQESENVSKACFDVFDAGKMNTPVLKALSDLMRITNRYPHDIQKIFTSLAKSMIHGMLAQAKAYVSMEWRTLAEGGLKEALDSFPLKLRSKKHMSVIEYTKYFGRNGIVAEFAKTYLERFYGLSSFRPIAYLGESFSLTQSQIDFFAFFVSHALLHNQQDKMLAKFSLTPKYMSSLIETAKINLAEETLVYKHGPSKKWEFGIPMESKSNVSTLEFTFDVDDSVTFKRHGDWSWLDILLLGQPRKISNKLWRITYETNHEKYVLELKCDQILDMLLSNKLKTFNLPQTL